jgi:uncharacterized protein DUF3667
MAFIRRRTLWMVLADYFAHSFAYDGRFWRTFIPLIAKPGWVTEQNLNERWVSFLPPLRMFLVISLAFFVTVTSVIPTFLEDGKGFMAATSEGEPINEPLPPDKARVFSEDWILTRKINDIFESKLKKVNELPPEVRNFALYRGMISAIPTTLLLAIPLFALGLKILQFFRRRYFFDHFVFATHFYSIWVLVLIPSILIQDQWMWIAGHAVYLPVYLFLAMKRVYRQHWFPTLAKMILLGFWQIISSVLLVLTVVLSAFLHL